MKIPDSPKQFFSIIPTDLAGNLKFRMELNKLCATDAKFQEVFLSMCRAYMPIFYSAIAWTLNPQKPPDERNQPFILRPAQITAVEKLDWCIQNQRDVGLNKSRKQGASELCCKLFAAKALLEHHAHFIIGSRKKELVDNQGNAYSLFAKIDNVMECLPSWWLKRCGYERNIHRKDMLLRIPETQSAIVGETTNESFSAGSRATALLLDEFGRVDKAIADSIEGSVHDVADSIIYSSTHWLGVNHTFNRVLEKDTTEVIELYWYMNPEENFGLYKTPEPGKVEIVDEEYYKGKDLYSALYLDNVSQLDPNSDKVQFVADGLKHLPSPYRSPWFDFQEKKRKGNRRDMVCNVCGTALGAADVPFDPSMLKAIKEQHVREPDFEGEITFEYDFDGIVDHEQVQFILGGQRRLKWWGDLHLGRPHQQHNFVIAIDPSYGLGSANSAVHIYDVNLREQVGSWVDSGTKPEDLADTIVALAYWIGGVNPPFLIWESNSGCGQTFGSRVVFNQYYNIYTQRVEDSKTRKKTRKWGWRAHTRAKEALLGDLGVALSDGLDGDKTYMSIIVHEKELVDELADCVFKEKGTGIVQARRSEQSTGAAERHGDRVIAAGLAVLGAKEQAKGDPILESKPRWGSFQFWLQEDEKNRKQKQREARRYLY